MIKAQRIENIRKAYKNEWLLIRVNKVEDSRPVNGWLINHNPDRSFIYKEITKHSSKYPVLAIYSQDNLPKGYAAAFPLMNV